MTLHAQPPLPSEKADDAVPALHPDLRLTLDVLIAARRERRVQTAKPTAV